jgi:hypothetical protein
LVYIANVNLVFSTTPILIRIKTKEEIIPPPIEPPKSTITEVNLSAKPIFALYKYY